MALGLWLVGLCGWAYTLARMLAEAAWHHLGCRSEKPCPRMKPMQKWREELSSDLVLVQPDSALPALRVLRAVPAK